MVIDDGLLGIGATAKLIGVGAGAVLSSLIGAVPWITL
jgi:hypothetical protein